ncbi:MAG: hypothetical protein FD143_3091 [Ignavibacteria bacterium]|nr:MAG: hypothetical protein FD143_3091 [Ignavibacteria bacterium]
MPPNIYPVIRSYEKENKRTIQIGQHLAFIRSCVTYNIIPKFAKFKACSQGTNQKSTYNSLCRHILIDELKLKEEQYDKARLKLKEMKMRLEQNIDSNPWYDTWIKKVELSSNRLLKNLKAKHERKLITLGMPHGFSEKGRLIYNFSTKSLTKLQHEILEKGTDYVRSNTRFDRMGCIVEVEKLFKEVKEHAIATNSTIDEFNLKQELRRITLNYMKQRRSQSNLTNEEKDALLDLLKNEEIIIVKSDKVKAFVVLNKNYYTKKGREFLYTTQFTKLPSNDTDLTLIEFQKFLEKLRRKKLIMDSELQRLKPNTYRNADAYFLPKIHKPNAFYNLKFRPIVSCSDSFTNNASKYLAKILKNAIAIEFNHQKCDSFVIQKELLSIRISPDTRLFGFDIENLYPSIPLDEAIASAVDLLVKHNLISIPKTELKKLLEFCTKRLTFEFEKEFFKQNDGVPMGSPIAPILSELFLLKLENSKFIPNFKENKIIKYWRYVDDGLLLLENNSNLETIKKTLNSMHPKIKFTFEIEEDNKMHFLDLMINRNDRGLVTTIYRKPSHPLIYHHWTSNIARNYKFAVVRNLFNRALRLCSTNWTKNLEMQNIQSQLLNSGYPNAVLKRILTQEIRKLNKTNGKENLIKKKQLYFGINYNGENSEQYARLINRLLRKYGPCSSQVQVYYRKSASFAQELQRPFRKKRVKANSNCIYRIDCKNCEKCYIGETGRQLNIRIKEHKSAKVGSASATVNTHAAELNHEIDFENVTPLRMETNMTKRKLLETLYMGKFNLFPGNQRSLELNLFN